VVGDTHSQAPEQGALRRVLYLATACVAVGASDLSLNYTQIQLAEFWNGTTWSVMPDLAIIGSDLLGVSCISSTDCTAVGDKSNFTSGRSLTLIESWNGTTWSTVPSPNAGSGDNFLSSVSCTSAASCVAAGVHYAAKLAGSAPLFESWNGTRWSIEPAPNKADNGEMDGVSCVSAHDCVAVGTYLTSTTVVNKTLIESWNGTRWSIEPVKGPQSELSGVSCVSATMCKAAGNDWNKAFNAQTYLESWNGRSWSTEPTPNKGSPLGSANILRGVSCASAGFCATVGNYGPVASYTLAEIGTHKG
jgi:hypothetical protein